MTTAELSIGSRLDWINHFIELHKSVDKNIRQSCGVNITQARIMFYIGTHEIQPIGKVASSLFLKPSTITSSVKNLCNGGFVTRSLDAFDRRRICIQLTQKGVDVTPGFIPAVRKAFEEDCPHVFEEKRAELRQLLLPASSHAFFDTDEDSAAAIAARIACDLQLDNSQDEIITHITRVLIIESISSFLSQMAEVEHKNQLSPNEARFLLALGNGITGVKLKELSALLGIRSNVASLSIHSLTKRGLISRAVDKRDTRAANVTLTRKGARLVNKVKGELCEIFDVCFSGLASRDVSECFPQ